MYAEIHFKIPEEREMILTSGLQCSEIVIIWLYINDNFLSKFWIWAVRMDHHLKVQKHNFVISSKNAEFGVKCF